MPLVFCFIYRDSIASDLSKRARSRELGILTGKMETGKFNAITDVPNVKVGHKTITKGKDVRTGVTAILPCEGNIFQEKIPAAIYIGNGFGKLTGYTQVEELGNIETPIILTNTLSVGTAVTAVIKYVLNQPGNENVRSVNAVVGETNDGYLNDIRGFHVTESDVLDAIKSAKSGPVDEGCVGAGTGTIAFGCKGGIGTSSRLIPDGEGGHYTIGVLVQTNYGGDLNINGVPVGEELKQIKDIKDSDTGSCMIVVATDALISVRNLKRIAKRSLFGLAKTGSVMSSGSGDYVICFSTAYKINDKLNENVKIPQLLPNEEMTPFFTAVIEATQEAVYNSIFMATTTTGQRGRIVEAISVDEVMKVYNRYKE
jgi:D-aminopeptidase